MITTLDGLALAKRVRDHLIEHPEQHDQGQFWTQTHCRTTACIAGWTAHFDGAVLDIGPAHAYATTLEAVTLVTGETIIDYAQRALGLTAAETEHLFYGLQDRRGALAYLSALIADAEVRLHASADQPVTAGVRS